MRSWWRLVRCPNLYFLVLLRSNLFYEIFSILVYTHSVGGFFFFFAQNLIIFLTRSCEASIKLISV